MRPKPRLSSLAWQDLDEVYDAVYETSSSETIAGATYEGIIGAIERASRMPNAFPSVEGRTGVACDYRWVGHKGWLAFYHVASDGGMIVDRVLWGRSDWMTELGLLDGTE